ncbi:putative vacuolar membrane transporter for cationic amino acids, partial [Rhizina undulata]
HGIEILFPPTQGLHVDVRAISGIAGSISIACWVVVFSPQILVNFQRGSADGLSLAFIVVWLAGDVFNVFGAILQGVLPTMIILAIYYTLADFLLLFQALYYRHTRLSCAASPTTPSTLSDSISHLSPATPLLNPSKPKPTPRITLLKAILFNTTAVLSVVLAGIVGWHISPPSHSNERKNLEFSPLGQIFGYLSAILYLFSRVPQILLNYRRKSCEGISLLFFLFACLGNLTYVISILAYVPIDTQDATWDWEEYWRYLEVNASWLAGSFGTLILDLVIFGQFWWYSSGYEGYEEEDEEEETEREIV